VSGISHISVSLTETLRLGRPLTAEVAASDPERRAGVTIVPLHGDLDHQANLEGWTPSIPDRTFFVYWREYSRQHIENDWDTAPNDGLWDLRRAEVVGEAALEDLLQSWAVPFTALTYSWKTDLPD